VGWCRSEVLRLPRKHKDAMHFNRESPATRATALRAIAKLPVSVMLIEVPKEESGLDARERAIRCLAKLAKARRPRRIVLELDASSDHHDRRWLRSELYRYPDIEYQHLVRNADALLWVADASAWAVQRDDATRRHVDHLIAETVLA